MKKTKIIATMGPASAEKETLRKMIEQGLNVCRLNFSHGSHEDHENTIKTILELNKEMGNNVAILADLQGPKIRTGEILNNGVELIEKSEVIITTDKMIGTADRFSINYAQLPQDVKAGEKILLDDGKLSLEILETNKSNEIKTKVIFGGKLSSHKGVNLPNTKISLPSLFFKAIDGITLFLPHEIIILLSHINFSVNKFSVIGVNFGGIKFQNGFNLIF